MGSVVFRDQDCVPEELVFHITYLGGDSPTYSLNFSQASLGVIAQYYNFLRLGHEGYERIMRNAIEVAEDLERRLLDAGSFESMRRDTFMPVVALRTTDGHDLSLYDLSERLRERGWIVPAYPLPANAQDITVLRMVVKENFGRDMAEDLAGDVRDAVDRIQGRRARAPREHGRTPRPIC
jgi:glutamate decarboxylase